MPSVAEVLQLPDGTFSIEYSDGSNKVVSVADILQTANAGKVDQLAQNTTVVGQDLVLNAVVTPRVMTFQEYTSALLDNQIESNEQVYLSDKNELVVNSDIATAHEYWFNWSLTPAFYGDITQDTGIVVKSLHPTGSVASPEVNSLTNCQNAVFDYVGSSNSDMEISGVQKMKGAYFKFVYPNNYYTNLATNVYSSGLALPLGATPALSNISAFNASVVPTNDSFTAGLGNGVVFVNTVAYGSTSTNTTIELKKNHSSTPLVANYSAMSTTDPVSELVSMYNNSTCSLEIVVHANKMSNLTSTAQIQQLAVFRRKVLLHRDNAGVVTIKQNITDGTDFNDSGFTPAAPVISVQGSGIKVQVTGIASNSIMWVVYATGNMTVGLPEVFTNFLGQ